MSRKLFPQNRDRWIGLWVIAGCWAMAAGSAEAMPVKPVFSPVQPATTVSDRPGYAYVPGGRRDPFMPVTERLRQAAKDRAPLQRVALSQLTLTGVVWGGFGARAMVQTPDGRGYTLHQGSLIGPNNAVVTAIAEDAITIQERVSDPSGRRFIREHVAMLGAPFAEVTDRGFRAGMPEEARMMAERPERSLHLATLSNTLAAVLETGTPPGTAGPYSYNPVGRRDPFAPVIRESAAAREADVALPPLQRVTLTEVTLIGVIWGGFGYSAMVQTPDGKGYTVNRGTVIGPNSGVVTAISENGITVEERFTDLYGKQQVREHVIPLRSKEKVE
jgi:Tfp pilus assembly protein PilP